MEKDRFSFVPYRGPYETIDNISKILKNKTYCELGSSNGVLLKYSTKYTTKSIGVENRPEAYNIAKKNNIDCLNIDARYSVLPETDIYYGWLGVYEIERDILLNIKKQYSNKIVIFSFSKNVHIEVESYKTHIDWCNKLNIKNETLEIKSFSEEEYHSHYENGFFQLVIYV
tara:strand:- start:189 stop:701 length:513 start_codon:yes stop_codon:yes gene_type:complete